MAVQKIQAKLIEKKRFSNRAYSIDVKIYEHNMARVEVNCKRRFRGRGYHGGYIPFDECILESMYDYTETLERMNVNKGARKWLRKVMKHCTQGLEMSGGQWDWDKVREKQELISHVSCMDLKLSVAHFQIIKRYMPELFVAGNYRMDYMKRHRVKNIVPTEERYFPTKAMLKSEHGMKHYHRKHEEAYFYAPKAMLLEMIKELSASFYKQIEKERTLDDCSVRLSYVWFHQEKPELRISVSDRTYERYTIHSNDF